MPGAEKPGECANVLTMDSSLDRYNRQMLLSEFGEEGQRRLLDSTVLILGCGALGSVAADMLSRAGVGHLVIVDRDIVESSNLQRQVLFDERDVADRLPKAEAARRHIAGTNSSVRVTAIVDDINASNIEGFADSADLLMDGLDNFETRYLANDVAVKTGLPYVYGAAVSTSGMSFPVLPHGNGEYDWERSAGGSLATPCFRCLFEEAPPPGTSPTCDTVGVLSTVVATVANVQVTEALKILTGNFDRVRRTILSLDLWSNEFMQLETTEAWEKGDCPCCKHRRFDYLDSKAGSSATAMCGRDAIQLRHRQRSENMDLDALAMRLKEIGQVNINEFMLCVDITDGDKPFEITLFPDGRAIIKGTQDAKIARGIYAKYVGN